MSNVFTLLGSKDNRFHIQIRLGHLLIGWRINGFKISSVREM
jgi:hypothetical protein